MRAFEARTASPRHHCTLLPHWRCHLMPRRPPCVARRRSPWSFPVFVEQQHREEEGHSGLKEKIRPVFYLKAGLSYVARALQYYDPQPPVTVLKQTH